MSVWYPGCHLNSSRPPRPSERGHRLWGYVASVLGTLLPGTRDRELGPGGGGRVGTEAFIWQVPRQQALCLARMPLLLPAPLLKETLRLFTL